MIEIITENNPIWDEEKKSFFEAQKEGSFNIPGLKLGQPLNCYATKLLMLDNKLIGVGTMLEKSYNSNKVFEVNIAIDESHSEGEGYGKLLLQSLEETVASNGPVDIIATIKSSNPDRNYVAIWFFKQGYIIETLFKHSENEVLKYCNNIFPRTNVTLTKHIN